MLLFFQILITMFLAELGDKTQLLMVAMTSKYKLRDIILGAGIAILVLNGLAVGLGSFISTLIPGWLIKIAAGLAFFYFAWSMLAGEEDEEEGDAKEAAHPVLAVFGTFFLAELGDKTQLTAIAFAANEGLHHAVLVWLACSAGLFAADLVGMLLGHLLKSKLPEGFLDKLALAIFAVFGFVTLGEGLGLLGLTEPFRWGLAIFATVCFAMLCFVRIRRNSGK
jgi:putative Ca2+/H+ antiporter (TMEM165/GDT1 family)